MQPVLWLLALSSTGTAMSCSRFADLPRQRDADLAAIERQTPEARAAELRQRVVRDALAPAPATIADDYVRLAGALLAVGDLDGSFAACEAGHDMAARARPASAGVPLSHAALRLEQQIWTRRRDPLRAEAARVLAEVEASAPSDPLERASRAAALLAKAAPELRRLALGSNSATPNDETASVAVDVLDSLRKGRPRAAIEASQPEPPAETVVAPTEGEAP